MLMHLQLSLKSPFNLPFHRQMYFSVTQIRRFIQRVLLYCPKFLGKVKYLLSCLNVTDSFVVDLQESIMDAILRETTHLHDINKDVHMAGVATSVKLPEQGKLKFCYLNLAWALGEVQVNSIHWCMTPHLKLPA
jgi:hypothetical protein